MVSPYGPAEKQLLLEADTLETVFLRLTGATDAELTEQRRAQRHAEESGAQRHAEES